jgi:hypothetical protein
MIKRVASNGNVSRSKVMKYSSEVKRVSLVQLQFYAISYAGDQEGNGKGNGKTDCDDCAHSADILMALGCRCKYVRGVQ